jgi:pyruvate/2-oxoglutarate dehydrogenase complex dihydrolipoamide dehydrogenase (E3) component
MTNNWNDDGDLKWFQSKGIAFYRGHGRLAGERAVEVEGPDGAMTRLTARQAVCVSCGTSGLIPPIEGLREAGPWTNVEATSAKELPKSLVVLGGGAIGAELAQCFKRLGTTEVTLLEGGPRLLSREEPFAGEEVAAAFQAEGITVVTGSKVTGVRREAPDRPVTAVLDDGREFTAEEILVAVGRRPRTTDIGLDTIGLTDLAGKYLDVDEGLRVKAAESGWLYAVGDVNGLALFTHMGKYQGRLFGDIVGGKDVHDIADHGRVPRVTFTDPQVAAAGLTEEQARSKGLDVRVVTYDIGSVSGTYVRGNGLKGTCCMVVDGSRRVVVGATFVGTDVQEIVHAATIAIVGEVTLDTLWHAVPSFPTMSEVWLRFLEAYGL